MPYKVTEKIEKEKKPQFQDVTQCKPVNELTKFGVELARLKIFFFKAAFLANPKHFIRCT